MFPAVRTSDCLSLRWCGSSSHEVAGALWAAAALPTVLVLGLVLRFDMSAAGQLGKVKMFMVN